MRCGLLSALLLCYLVPLRAENVFAPWLADTPPKIVETVSRETVGAVEITRLKWLNRVDAKTGREVIIYGILARPTAPGPHPGVLVCHGGGGYADMVASQVIGWAKKGYVAVCQDEPGICNVKLSGSSGPCFDNRNAFSVVDGPEDTALFDGVVAALNGLALLRSQPDVDRRRIGVTGGSWGGYLTTMVTGLAGDRVKAAFSVFGCGFYDVGSTWQVNLDSLTPERRAIWLEHLDAGRRAGGMKAAYMVATALNDWFFWPSAMTSTYQAIAAPKNICFMPNDSHVLSQPGGTAGPPEFDRRENRTWMEQVWLNYHLKGEGEAFPTASEPTVAGREVDGVRVRFRADGPSPITAARVWYAAGELPWRLKWWAPASTQRLADGRYEALIPVDEPGQAVDWVGLATDERQLTVSTLLQRIEPATVGLAAADGGPSFRQDFEQADEDRRWGREYLERRPGRERRAAEAAHEGRFGLELKDEATFACTGFRAATVKRRGAEGLRFWIRSAGQECPMPRVDLLAEAPDGQRYVWQWPAGEPLTATWREVRLPFSALAYAGKNPAPFELWSPALGLLRFHNAAGAQVYLDDVALY